MALQAFVLKTLDDFKKRAKVCLETNFIKNLSPLILRGEYMKIKISLFMIAFLCLNATFSFAEDVFTNDPIVVTATRYESSVSKEGKAITVVTEDEIKRSGKKTLADVLETVAGVTVTRYGTEGSLSYVYIRGSKSGNVLIMIDGVKISDPMSIGNMYDISSIMTSDIERIEIVKGAMSSIYGAEASGGVINIITKKGKDRKVVIKGEIGSNKSFAESVSVSDYNGTSSFYFSGSHYKTDGISSAKKRGTSDFDSDSFENITASGKMESKLSDKASILFSMNYTDSKLDSDDGSFEDDPNNIYTSKLFTSRGEFSHSLFKWWNYKLGASCMSFVRENIDPADSIDTTENSVYTYNGSNYRLDFSNKFNLFDINVLTVGFDLVNDKGRSTSAYYDDWSSANSISIFNDKSIFTRSFFVHDSLTLFDILNINAGARLDDNDVFGQHWTWDSSASIIVPATGTKFHGSTGTGFRAPSLFELYGQWGGNKNLNPEKSFVYDGGIYQELFGGDFFFDLTYFVQEYKDKIIWISSKYDNLEGKVKNSGVELSSGIKILSFLRANYSYTYIKYDETNDSSATLKRPAHKHAASVTVIPLEGLDITASYIYSDERKDVYYDPATWSQSIVTLASYHKFDLNIRYSLNDTVTFTFKGENLTDEDYMETYGYNTKGRSFYGGAEITL